MSTQPQERIVRRRELESLTALSRSAIYDRLDSKSPRYDAAFPRPISLGSGHAVGWSLTEVMAWIETKKQERNVEVAQ